MTSSLAIRIRLLKLLPDAGYPITTLYTALLVVSVLLPAATALATAAVVSRIETHAGQPGAFSFAVPPLIFLAAALVGAQLVSAAHWPVLDVAYSRINATHRERLALLALGTPTITELERPHVQDLIKAASAESTTWVEKTPADGALSQLQLMGRYLGVAASALVVARFSWWLVPVIVVPAFVARAVGRREWLAHFRVWRRGIAENRQFKYWGNVATSPAEGKELRIFGLEGWLVARGQRHMRTHLEPVWASHHRVARSKWLIAILIFVPLAVAFAGVGLATAHGHGTLAAETVVLTSAWSVFAAIGGTYDAMAIEGATPVMEAYEELEQLLAAQPHSSPTAAPAPGSASSSPSTAAAATTATTTAAATPEHRPAPLVRFEGVGFTYPDSTRTILDALSFEIRPGELLAVVGLNGAGKSTMTKILAGLYEPTEGRVTADGVDIRDLGHAAWRRQLSIVFQDFVKYPLTARENVKLGALAADADADTARHVLEGAARDSGLVDVLDRLPLGWDTPLSKSRVDGVDLSGGQWQQVVLARALFAVRTGARILVLDEPTAHLDVRTEFEVFQRLADAASEASVVLISHRLSTVRQADRIVLLDAGRIAESGSHDELIARGGRYAEMFAIQAERFVRGYQDVLEEGELL
ncbi:MAG TPA: ABC transporter ATP-binding protein [Actinocrinis sp.]|nr:ABC transporter ATP-binding protein [Actinocrinis sp.]